MLIGYLRRSACTRILDVPVADRSRPSSPFTLGAYALRNSMFDAVLLMILSAASPICCSQEDHARRHIAPGLVLGRSKKTHCDHPYRTQRRRTRSPICWFFSAPRCRIHGCSISPSSSRLAEPPQAGQGHRLSSLVPVRACLRCRYDFVVPVISRRRLSSCANPTPSKVHRLFPCRPYKAHLHRV